MPHEAVSDTDLQNKFRKIINKKLYWKEHILQLIEKITDRVVHGSDKEWAMNIHSFDWVPGVGLYGIWKAWEVTGKDEYLDFLTDWAGKHLEDAYRQKTVNSTAPMIAILELYKKSGKEAYRKVCQDMAEYVLKEAPLTIDGGLEHTVTENASFDNQMWADTLFMVCIFMARFGRLTGNRSYTEFASDQLVLHYRYLWDEETGLFYHGWDGTSRTHLSSIHWGRANAWIIYSTVEILNEVGEFEERDDVIRKLQRHASSLTRLQRDNGLFGSILDDPTSYDELSASAGIACGIKRGIRFGYVDGSLENAARRVYKVLPQYVDETGTVQGVSGGTPIMKTAKEYRDIPVIPTLYGQALTCLALADFEQE